MLAGTGGRSRGGEEGEGGGMGRRRRMKGGVAVYDRPGCVTGFLRVGNCQTHNVQIILYWLFQVQCGLPARRGHVTSHMWL